ncbi:aspartate aminotransferase family protein [Allomuricauda sp. CP2A]|jgi:4-aminobutyrate aminotransferase|uniref:aspartate aminotransferase family protein n=1 Tax=Allomuricauda sp. CP2A TaxID=1848189 RepID=UPI0009F4F7F6|nr:aminotransferase class III-fold pyridoxal phosphate-dependent enzyme [Muricauda sp. CP2A]
MSQVKESILASETLLSNVWTHLTHIQPVSGKGAVLRDADNKEYLDFTSGIGVINTGHCHPRVVRAIQEQADQLIFGQMNCVIPPTTIKMAEKLNEITPDHIDRFFFSNSGSEATEAAVKLAKSATGRSNIIVFQGSFHGRTHLSMAMTTSKTVFRHKYQPLPSGIFVTPFPYAYYFGWDEATTIEFCKKQLDLVLTGQTAPDETAAIIIEPVIGEGGYVPAPAGFLHHLRKVCDEHGILLIIDEVQSGFGRTGKFFCFEHSNVKPDIIVMAKGLGSGFPVSAIASTSEIMDKWTPGTHGGTYGGGSALAGAAACETIDVIREEKLLENCVERGKQLKEGLKVIQRKYPVIGDVRGMGLMVATEFTNVDGTPNSEVPAQVIRTCVDQGLLLLNCGSYKNVVRWIPPLVVTEEQIEQGVKIFESALKNRFTL